MGGERGFILLFTFMLMIVLTVLVGVLLYMATYETRDIGAQVDDCKLLSLAEAGVHRALREIREDVLATTQTGTADLRGADTTGSISVGDVERIRYIDSSTATINNNGDAALLRTFDANYTNSRIKSVLLCVRAYRVAGGTGATIQVTYATSGVFPEAGNTILTQALTTVLTDYTANITGDRAWTWPVIMSPNFILRAARIAGDRNTLIDALYLRVTYEIDTNTEAWSTAGYAGFPITLGSGKIESVSITDEAGKVHLNYASQPLLRYLMGERGIPGATADTLATNIVNHRGASLADPFETVEELQQVAGMTAEYYNLIKEFVTVYSSVNTNVTRPGGPRAPINVNTAPREVLEAVFDPMGLGAADPASLATDIINTRASAPFTCFYSSDAAVVSDFYDFVMSRPYLSAAGSPDERDRVLDNADASLLVPVAGSTGFNALTTEFCYATTAFKVDSLADVNVRGFRIKTILGDDGSHVFTTFVGDTSGVGYRKENFE